jgi:hypothetical protein
VYKNTEKIKKSQYDKLDLEQICRALTTFSAQTSVGAESGTMFSSGTVWSRNRLGPRLIQPRREAWAAATRFPRAPPPFRPPGTPHLASPPEPPRAPRKQPRWHPGPPGGPRRRCAPRAAPGFSGRSPQASDALWLWQGPPGP